MNIKEAARRAGISVRTLRYYEEVGLISPVRSAVNDYREYDECAVKRARMIHAYRELQFSMKEIARLLDAPRGERVALLQAHIEMLEERQRRIQNRIELAQSIRMFGSEQMAEIDFADFDAQMLQARQNLEQNAGLRELSARMKAQSEQDAEAMAQGLLCRMAEIAGAGEEGAVAAVEGLRNYIEEHLYPCTDQMLRVYARMFSGDGALAQTFEDMAGIGAPERLRARIEAVLGSK